MDQILRGHFSFAGEMIASCFLHKNNTYTGGYGIDHEKIITNYNFLNSKIVASFCDCSDNFNQDRLITIFTNRYKRYVKFNN